MSAILILPAPIGLAALRIAFPTYTFNAIIFGTNGFTRLCQTTMATRIACAALPLRRYGQSWRRPLSLPIVLLSARTSYIPSWY